MENQKVKQIIFTDKSGNELKTIDLDGVPIPAFPEEGLGKSHGEHFRKLKEMTIRDDDVIICAYPKAGTHWIWEVSQMLKGQTTEYHKHIKEQHMFESTNIDSFDAEPSPRVLNSHLWPRHLPKQMFEKKTKIIYLIRNPKDTVVSLFFQYNALEKSFGYHGNLSDFIDLNVNKGFHYGLWYEYVLEWEKFLKTTENPFYQLSYEDMQQNPLHHVKGLAKFLETDVSGELCEEIVDACSFNKLKNANDEVKEDFIKPYFKEGTSFYRKGKVGDWKNWLTVAESENIDRMTAERMKHSQIKFKYTI
ncbi:sulfotransferase 1B1-like [Patella vulgata]|uniref:sulfotransferase 1B1-like n=1 Tax=Patella vulgata TaxID=6465 RepID=UPI0024A8B950|nr:sulfotransferase 1B1-like [Patella vulgata]XP_055957182.1 sulfotransferase 1B1-like [Patella vulgata]XP_055957183.1 sulfotransferase 1B1-like [Patella vulgata]